MYKTLQIMVAHQGWEAILLNKEDASFHAVPLVGWALIEKGGSPYQDVVGLLPPPPGRTALATVVDEGVFFVGYNYPGCSVNWAEQARERWSEQDGES